MARPSIAPGATAPVGTASGGAGRAGTQPRSKQQLGDNAPSAAGDDGGTSGSGRPRSGPARVPASSSTSFGSVGTAVSGGAGVLLGLLFWGWVVMPFLKGGTGEVRRVLMAKFVNRTPDGRWLP